MRHCVAHTIFLLFVLVNTSIRGQGITIEYDYLNPTNARWRYESGRDTAYHQERHIRVKREAAVKIRVQNVNADALQSEIMVRKGPNADSLVISSLLGLVSTYAAPAGLDLKGLLALKSRGAGLTVLQYAPLQVDLEAARSFATASVSDLDASIRDRLAEVARWRSVREQIKALRYNPTLPKPELIRRSHENLAQLAATAPGLFENDTQARTLLGQLALENAEYLRYALTLLEQKATASTTASRGDATQPDFNQFMITEAIRQHRKVVTDDLADQLTTILHETLTHYQALSRNTFAASLNTTIDRNSEAIVLQFYDNSTPASSTDKRKVVRTDRFTVSPPGQWQLSTSFGLSFLQFSQRLQSYAIVNSRVAASDLDLLTPTLVGLFQFLQRGTGYVRGGMHLGVGIPLTDPRGVSFLIGPSLVLGKQNAISLNAGVFTAKATRLGGGLVVGDEYKLGVTTPPTINRYEWGYHVGLSFQFGLRR